MASDLGCWTEPKKDLKRGESTEQHLARLMETSKGLHWGYERVHPTARKKARGKAHPRARKKGNLME